MRWMGTWTLKPRLNQRHEDAPLVGAVTILTRICQTPKHPNNDGKRVRWCPEKELAPTIAVVSPIVASVPIVSSIVSSIPISAVVVLESTAVSAKTSHSVKRPESQEWDSRDRSHPCGLCHRNYCAEIDRPADRAAVNVVDRILCKIGL